MLKPLLVVAAVLLVLTLLLYGYLYVWTGERLRSPEELAQTALGNGPDADKEKAALDLARSGDKGREQMRRVLKESTNADVRAAVMQGLGELRDADSLPDMMKALDDSSEKVRGRAGVAIRNTIGPHRGPPFQANDPPAKRGEAIRAIQQEYQRYKNKPPNENS